MEETQEKEPKLITNRGFVVDLIFNFPQGVAVDKESYVSDIINHIKQAFLEGNPQGTEEQFEAWLKKSKQS